MSGEEWTVHNPAGTNRVIVTKRLPGSRWLDILTRADCRIEVCRSDSILSTETWGQELFSALKKAGGRAYSNYAVGFNNVDVAAATAEAIPVGNTPGVLTEATAEMAVALTFAAGRRVAEADKYMRAGRFDGWVPTLFLGEGFSGKTVGVIGAGRIGAAYALMMVEGLKMNLIYFDLLPNMALEAHLEAYNKFLESRDGETLGIERAENLEEVLRRADVVSLHTVLDESTQHLINAERLALMKENAVLVNTARGPLIDEEALVEHCKNNPRFRVGLDVFEHEPKMAAGLAQLDNVVIQPHIASATYWTRTGMATLAACNVAAMIMGYPAWDSEDILPFLGDNPPAAAPSILNADDLGIKRGT